MLNIRALKEDELELLFKSSKSEQLDVEELHLRCQYRIHPQDFIIAHEDDSLIGFIVALRQSDDFGFISTFLVLREFRNKGYGTQILNFALEHLGERQVALDSILEATSIYEKAGFKSYFDLHTFLYITQKQTPTKETQKFINYDESTSQNEYLKCLLSNQDVNYKAIENDKLISSYGLCFKHKDGYKVVIDSTNYQEAKAIFFELIKELELDMSIYIEATKLNPVFLKLAKELEMIECAPFARMYNKVL